MRMRLAIRLFIFAPFALVGLACGLTGQLADQNDQPLNANQAGPGSSNDDIPSIEDTIPGPAVLSLDDASLYQYRDKNFATTMQMEYEGSTSGFVTIEGIWVANSPPDWSFTFDTSLPLWQGFVPFTYASTGGLLYGNTPVSGCYLETDDLENPFDDYFIDENYLTGEVPLVESGVIVNGAVTDRYQVTHENQMNEEESAFYDFIFTDSTGSVYVDRISKVIVRFDQSGTGLDRSSLDGGGQEIQSDFQLDFSLTNSAGQFTVPDGCDDASLDDEFDFGDAGDIPFPVMEDAYNITAVFGLYSYETEYNTDQVVEFYLQELPALGWALSGDPDTDSPSFYINFLKDGEELQILVSEGEQPGTTYILITHFN